MIDQPFCSVRARIGPPGGHLGRWASSLGNGRSPKHQQGGLPPGAEEAAGAGHSASVTLLTP